MKKDMTINGIRIEAFYHDEDVNRIILPLLEELGRMQREKGARLIVMIAAPPGAGKTTFGRFLEELACEALPEIRLQCAGMDGFHRRQEYLTSHALLIDGRQVPMVDVKGAPETFDLESLRKHIEKVARGEKCSWPGYDRKLHNPVEDETLIDCDILLLEGNYLLLEEEGWNELSGYADYTIFLRAEAAMLRERLVDRKEASGNTRAKAEAFVDFSDMRNVRRCLEKSKKADLTLRIQADGRLEPMKILMLGNSLTAANHMPIMLGKMLDAEVYVHARGGARLAEQLNPETKMGARTDLALREHRYDYVVLQEMSHGPMTAPDRYKDSVRRLAGRIREADAEPVIYATWAFRPGCEKLAELGVDAEEMHRRMQQTFAEIAQECDLILANAGEAFHAQGFDEKLYAPDGLHPSEMGSRIAAETIAQVIREFEVNLNEI